MLHYLIDEAIPGNKIPRVFINTGIEYVSIVNFVKSLQKDDDRFVIIQPGVNIKTMLEEKGYPFKSKEHSDKVRIYQHSGIGKTVSDYLNNKSFGCPQKLRYQFTDENKLKISKKCCDELKKKPANKWMRDNKKSIVILGITGSEKGVRSTLKNKGCFFYDNGHKRNQFNPMIVIDETFIDWYVSERNIKLCELYYPPYNFKRTGCKGCPFAYKLQKDLDILETLLPKERKQCEIIWKPVYEEYRRIGYRLKTPYNPDLF